MTHTLLDPWDDAAKIASTLAQPNSALVIALGAEWCHLCTDFKPTFYAAAESDNTNVWLWYNLEEHEELLGDFYPETLPLVWVYQGPQLTRYGTPAIKEPTDNAKQTTADFTQTVPIMAEAPKPEIDLRRFLLQENWAV